MLLARTVTVLTIGPLLLTFWKSDLSMISIKAEDKAAKSLGVVALITGAELAGLSGMVLWHLALAFLSVKSVLCPGGSSKGRGSFHGCGGKSGLLGILVTGDINSSTVIHRETTEKFERHIVLRALMRHPSRAWWDSSGPGIWKGRNKRAQSSCVVLFLRLVITALIVRFVEISFFQPGGGLDGLQECSAME